MDPTRRLPDRLVEQARAFTDGTTEPVEPRHASTVVLTYFLGWRLELDGSVSYRNDATCVCGCGMPVEAANG